MRLKEFVREDFEHLDPNMSGGLAKSGNRNAVKELQQWLNDNGYEAGSVDGIYGSRTAGAVREFQTDNGLTVDGDAGKETISAMLKTTGTPVAARVNKAKSQVDSKLISQIPNDKIVPALKDQVERFLGAEVDVYDLDLLIRATAAEASANSKERAGVAAVILNRVRSGRYPSTIEGVLTQRNQFQAVTGTSADPGPSSNFTNVGGGTVRGVAKDIIQYLGSMSKSWLNFTANNPKAYGPGTNLDFMYTMRDAPNSQVVGQTVFGTA